MAKDTHTDSRRQTMGERPSGKSRKLNLNATGCTAGDGQTGRKIESRIKRERERQEEGNSGFTKDSARQWQLICMLYEDIITSGNFSFMRAHSAVAMSRQALLSRQLVHISPGNGLTEWKGGRGFVALGWTSHSQMNCVEFWV